MATPGSIPCSNRSSAPPGRSAWPPGWGWKGCRWAAARKHQFRPSRQRPARSQNRRAHDPPKARHARHAQRPYRPARRTAADRGQPTAAARLGCRLVQRAVCADRRAAGRNPGDLCQPNRAPGLARRCRRQRHPPQVDQRTGHCPPAGGRRARGAGRARRAHRGGQRSRRHLCRGGRSLAAHRRPLGE